MTTCFEVHDAVVYLEVKFDATFCERHFELSIEIANRRGRLGNFVTGCFSHIQSFLWWRQPVYGRMLRPV